MLLTGKEFRSSGRRLLWESADRLVLTEGGGCAWVVVGAVMVAAGFYCILAGNMSDMVLPGRLWTSLLL